VSGPATDPDEGASVVDDRPAAGAVEITEGRAAEVGGFGVRRLHPLRRRRTVGRWWVVDHMGPGRVERGQPFDVGPHPHIGLQTVTWLLEGAVLHRDSLGSEQLIRPGQLNLMTAGGGVAHAEETTGVHVGRVHGVQLWVALPEATRHGEAAFEHHAELPQVELGGATATVLVGDLAGAASPARRDTDHVGAEVAVRRGRTVVPLVAAHEHAVVVLEGAVQVGPHRLEPGSLADLGVGRDELAIDAVEPARLLLLGGAPFPEPLVMWWNYVARTRDEIVAAHEAWSSGSDRFGTVASAVPRIDVPGPPWAGAAP
jgi:redox-sensitive bicupin YhaK (pirin superfamily)